MAGVFFSGILRNDSSQDSFIKVSSQDYFQYFCIDFSLAFFWHSFRHSSRNLLLNSSRDSSCFFCKDFLVDVFRYSSSDWSRDYLWDFFRDFFENFRLVSIMISARDSIRYSYLNFFKDSPWDSFICFS